MNIYQLKCFLAAAETLHFGRAAQSMDILPASLGRQIKNLEDSLETSLFVRTTRSVSLSPAGAAILEDARKIVERSDELKNKVRSLRQSDAPTLRVGAIDSAAAGLMPQLLKIMREERPDVQIQLYEQKTIRLLPRLLSGSLDIAFCRPPDVRDANINFRTLFYETAVVALPSDHPLASAKQIKIQELQGEPLIVPDRRSRPHSHDLSINAFTDAGLTAQIVQVAEEKHTIVNLVSTGAGIAIVPKWTARIAVQGVQFIPLALSNNDVHSKLVLAAAWAKGTRDEVRDVFFDVLMRHLEVIRQSA